LIEKNVTSDSLPARRLMDDEDIIRYSLAPGG
jgi:hypothetical protein